MPITTVVADYQNPQHAADISFLLNSYAQDPMGGGNALPQHVQDNLANELAKVPNAFSVLCYVDGKPAGLTNCLQGFSTFKCEPLLNIHDVVVVSGYRGKQISQHMLQKVEDIAVERDCCKITLEVLEGNVVAKNAYIKFGFAGYALDPAMGNAMFWEKSLAE
jgi:ribosomal protein S18 acetylase RimI-like enzyme